MNTIQLIKGKWTVNGKIYSETSIGEKQALNAFFVSVKENKICAG